MRRYGFSENLLRKFEFRYILTRIAGTLHADVCILIITCLILCRMKNVSDKVSEEI